MSDTKSRAASRAARRAVTLAAADDTPNVTPPRRPWDAARFAEAVSDLESLSQELRRRAIEDRYNTTLASVAHGVTQTLHAVRSLGLHEEA